MLCDSANYYRLVEFYVAATAVYGPWIFMGQDRIGPPVYSMLFTVQRLLSCSSINIPLLTMNEKKKHFAIAALH